MKSYVLLTALALVLSATPAKADKVVATVNGQQITQTDVDTFYAASPAKAQGLPKDVIQPAIIDQLISMKLIDEKVAASNIAENADVKKRVEEARTEILRDVWLEQQVNKQLTDDKIKAEYEKFTKELSGEYEVKASHILVDTEEQAKAIIAELDKGADFTKLATEKSIGPSGKDGGSLGYFTKGAMVPAFSDVAFATAVGTYTKQPVQTQFGWHVIKVEDKRKIEPPAYDDVKDRIKVEASREILTKVIDELQAGAKIEKPDAPKVAPKKEVAPKTETPKVDTPKGDSKPAPKAAE